MFRFICESMVGFTCELLVFIYMSACDLPCHIVWGLDFKKFDYIVLHITGELDAIT